MSRSDPTVVADTECHTGEGPLWHPDEGRLYWCDIPRGRLFRYDPRTDTHERCYEADGPIGGFTIQSDGALLLFGARGRVWTWDDGVTDTVVESVDGEAGSRFNDVIADPEGRVFCGTMPTDDRAGRLYRLDTDGSVVELRDDVGLPNGLGFTPDRGSLYFTDSERTEVLRYDYDAATGEIRDPETVVDLSGEAGIPDGMTVDREGNVWSARWDGGCLVGYRPDGREFRRVEFPARKVSSVTFGGGEYRDAYVTTALGPAPASGEGTPGTRAEEGGGAGATFRVDLGVRGVAEFRSGVAL
jgi:D-xylonolactonase